MAKDPTSLAALNQKLIAAAEPMVKGGTWSVLGEGPLRPGIAFVGEQPGDQEDMVGKPFVGPAGKLLDKAMEQAGIDFSPADLRHQCGQAFQVRAARQAAASFQAADGGRGIPKHYRWWWLEKGWTW